MKVNDLDELKQQLERELADAEQIVKSIRSKLDAVCLTEAAWSERLTSASPQQAAVVAGPTDTITGGQPVPKAYGDIAQAVRTAVNEIKDPFKMSDIEQRLKMSGNTVLPGSIRTVLGRMLKQGTIQTVSKGRGRIAGVFRKISG